MDYLDELDDDAIEALAELGVSTEEHQTAHANMATHTTKLPRITPRRQTQSTYLLRLEYPLLTPREVAHCLGLQRLPKIEVGEGEEGVTYSCHLEQTAVETLDMWTVEHFAGKKWTKTLLNRAHKDVAVPCLGRDATLPHHRPSASISPAAQKYPVNYFFYGTLASPDCLARLFGIKTSDVAALRPAICFDGQIQIWADRYRALVDCPGGKVEGHVFTVKSVDEEEALRVYEGSNYEVVRAEVEVDGKRKECLTFRFVGSEDDLGEQVA